MNCNNKNLKSVNDDKTLIIRPGRKGLSKGFIAYVKYEDYDGKMRNTCISSVDQKEMMEKLDMFINNGYHTIHNNYIRNNNNYVNYEFHEKTKALPYYNPSLVIKPINLEDYPKAIRNRIQDTNGRYLNIGKPQAGHTCHHILPYFSCKTFWNNAEDNEEYEKYMNLACISDNIIELPYDLHKKLHNVTFKSLRDLYVKDNEGRKYIPKENMNAYLIGMLNGFNRISIKNHNHYDNFSSYLKEYALKTVDLLDDNEEVKELADKLDGMTNAFAITEFVRVLVRKMRRLYL